MVIESHLLCFGKVLCLFLFTLTPFDHILTLTNVLEQLFHVKALKDIHFVSNQVTKYFSC